MSTQTREMLDLDDAVSAALGRQPGESLRSAAERVMRRPHGDPRWRVARAIIAADPKDPWRAMRVAAKAAKRIGR